jgi:hypothetical protein
MKVGTIPVFFADDGTAHNNIEDAAKASAKTAMERLVGGHSSHYEKAIDLLCDRWYVLHSELLRINEERCRLAEEHGV